MEFTQQQISAFKEVTGNNIEDFHRQLKKDKRAFRAAMGRTKHIFDSVLNKQGLQPYRAIYLENVWIDDLKETNQYDKETSKFFIENGYFIKKDFLPERIFSALPKSAGKYHMIAEMEKAYKEVLTFAGSYISKWPEVDKFFQLKIHEHFKEDDQYQLHIDQVRPRIKSWLYLHDVEKEQGPLGYVPKSNQNTVEKLNWIYETSMIADNKEHPLFFNRHISLPRVGSYRVNLRGETEPELKNMNLGEERMMCVKKNTLIVADTRGFHRRTPASPGVIRTAARFNILL